MVHLWVRAEQRADERRVGLMPDGVAELVADGFRVTVEDSRQRVVPIDGYAHAGAEIAPEGSWPGAPDDAIVFGLKELPADGSPLRHRHIMFGHAFKGQIAGKALLERFRDGDGTLLDLEYLVDEQGRRLAAFGYWAGFAGAAVAALAWGAQKAGVACPAVAAFDGRAALTDLAGDWLARAGGDRPDVIIVGAKGRVGTGAADLCAALGLQVTGWDMAETAHGGPFPELLTHDIFLNCILAQPGTPVLVPANAGGMPRRLGVIGDIACDPDSDYNPVPLYDRATGWDAPALRVHAAPPLDVVAIDNLPSLLPLESSEDFARQLLPVLKALGDPGAGVWARAAQTFRDHCPPG